MDRKKNMKNFCFICLILVTLTSCSFLSDVLLNGVDNFLSSEQISEENVVTGLKVDSISKDKISISWNKVDYAQSYNVYIGDFTAQPGYDSPYKASKIDSARGTYGEYSGFNPGCRYCFYITSVVAGKESYYSLPLEIISSVDTPKSLEIIDCGTDYVYLYWESQIYQDGSFAKYRVKYNDITIDVDKNYCLIEDLQPNTQYDFSVTTLTSHGKENSYKTITQKTLSTLKSNNVGIYLIDKDATQIELNSLQNNDVYLVTIASPNALNKNVLRYITTEGFENYPTNSVVSSRSNSLLDENLQKIQKNQLIAEKYQAEGKVVSGVYDNGFVRLEKQDLYNIEKGAPISHSRSEDAYSRASSYVVGSKKKFYVKDGLGLWKTKDGELLVQGEYCNFWIDKNCLKDTSVRNNDNYITKKQIQQLADKFDIVYPYITNVFGQKHSSDKEYIIKPQDKVSVFLHDLEDDYSCDQSGGVVGYFMPYDMYEGMENSNELELFHIDVHFVDVWQDLTFSTLAHEFQHMLHYVQKDYTQPDDNLCMNEMMSLLCEDMVQQILDLDDSSSPKSRISEFITSYYKDNTFSWTGETVDYATAYTFGAWLLRNFGGIELLQAMAYSGADVYGEDTIETAIKTLYDVEITVMELYEEFVLATIVPFLDENKANEYGLTTLNKEIQNTINGFTYTLTPIDLTSYVGVSAWNTVTNGLFCFGGSGSYDKYGNMFALGLNRGSFVVQKISDLSGDRTLHFNEIPNNLSDEMYGKVYLFVW